MIIDTFLTVAFLARGRVISRDGKSVAFLAETIPYTYTLTIDTERMEIEKSDTVFNH